MRTAFTELFGLEHPLANAPMGGSAGGALAAAVANAGGVGFVGAGGGERTFVDRELGLVRDGTERPWGVGFLTWATDAQAVAHALSFQPHAVMLSFGDAAPLVPVVRDSGAKLVLQVGTPDEAVTALELGADVVVAQGGDAGGHGARRARGTMAFVPYVVDLAGATPVLAAGGIVDGRGLAAALALGAAGALVGTRFQATPEALVDPAISAALVEGRRTVRSRDLDVLRRSSWPEKYDARTLDHPMLGGPTDEAAQQRYRDGVADGSLPPLPVWAGEGVDLIHDLVPAGELVSLIAEGAAWSAWAMAAALDPS